MIRFPVSPSKAEDLRRRMAALCLAEDHFAERFFCPQHGRSAKRHAQTAVHLYHAASKTEVRCFKSTSQALNRFLARRMLVRQLEKLNERPSRASKKPTGDESSSQHMHRMFVQNFERDIAQPYPIPSQKLLGIGDLPRKLIGVLGERETLPRSNRRSS